MTTFASLDLCPELQSTLQQLDYQQPTPIQAKAIPLILQGRDLLAEAQTGTGKTASFSLPLIELLKRNPNTVEPRPVRVLVLTPTRELTQQVAEMMQRYGRAVGMRAIAVFGGVRLENQCRKLERGVDILVATPGRLLELLDKQYLNLDQLQHLVLDEADRMLDLGFAESLQSIMRYVPKQRQTLLFSATADQAIETLAGDYLNRPEKVRVAPRNSASRQVKQYAYQVDNGDKADVLSYMIREGHLGQTLVFARTKKRVDNLVRYLRKDGIDASGMHGDLSQRERSQALQAFSDGQLHILVATDVAARGLDIDALPQVVNYDLPNQPEAYVHRIGRTGRAGETGRAYSLVSTDEKDFLRRIEALTRQTLTLTAVPLIENGHWQEAQPAVVKKPKRAPKPEPKPARKAKPEGYQADRSQRAVRPSLFKK